MKWLVSAFEPFAGASTNSSWTALNALAVNDWQGQVEFFAPLPVTFDGAWPALREKIKLSNPDGVLVLGQAAGRQRLGLERVALNWVDTRGADNAGVCPKQAPLDQGGELAIWSNIPWARLEDSPLWERSYSAGTFVCNALMYDLTKWSQQTGRLAGFVHVPLFESLSEEQAVSGLARILGFLTGL